MHSLIVGVTESGKSTLAKALARRAIAQGRPVLVVNPTGERGYTGHITRDPALALDLAKHHLKGAYILLDEAPDYLNAYKENAQYLWFLRRSRHQFHSTWIITQRAQLVNRNARSQCTRLYAFAQHQSDADLLAAEWNCAGLRELPRLQRGEFMMVKPFSEPEIRRIF